MRFNRLKQFHNTNYADFDILNEIYMLNLQI